MFYFVLKPDSDDYKVICQNVLTFGVQPVQLHARARDRIWKGVSKSGEHLNMDLQMKILYDKLLQRGQRLQMND